MKPTGKKEVIEADMVLLAMGFLKPEQPKFAKNVFLAGDAETGASLVVRAAIIETLFAREYVRREKKSLVPTDKGLAVYAVVRDKKIADVAMTGGWELALSKIATGEMDAPTFHRGIEVFASQIAKELLEARIDGAESDTACPRCGRPVVFYPKLAKCQNPDCGLTVWRTVARKELTDKQLAELLTKGKTGTIRGFVKNGGGTFDAALTLDDQFKTSFVFEPRDTPRQGKRNKRK